MAGNFGECLTCGRALELQCNGSEPTEVGHGHGWIRCWRNDEPAKACGNAGRARLICPRCEPEKRQPLFAEARP